MVATESFKRIGPKAPSTHFYDPAVAQHKISRKRNTSAKLRSSITPGTVLILLAGKFRGKRVVFLKQLPSGLLLVSGPFKINGVPLKRVNQSYVIATSTKVDLSTVTVPEKVNDAYFSKEKAAKGKGTEKEFFEGKKGSRKSASSSEEKKAFPSDKAEDQKSLDKALLEAVKKTESLDRYLATPFSLSRGQLPHLLKF